MHWLQQIDAALFRGINLTTANPLFDLLMPFLSWNPLFVPAILLTALWLIWKGGRRGRVCLGVLVATLIVGDVMLTAWLKRAIHRPRPFHVIQEARVLVGRTTSGSMPSSHTVNWFAAAVVAGRSIPPQPTVPVASRRRGRLLSNLQRGALPERRLHRSSAGWCLCGCGGARFGCTLEVERRPLVSGLVGSGAFDGQS